MLNKIINFFFSAVLSKNKQQDNIIFLNVPYVEKDQAKALGAKWNPNNKKWFITSKYNQENFIKWLPQTQSNDDELREHQPNDAEWGGLKISKIGPDKTSIILKGKIFLLQSYEKCYRCGNLAHVFCLGSEGLIDLESDYDLDGFFTFSFIKGVPENIKNILKEHAPNYCLDFTKVSNTTYYVNHCKCKAKLGDHFLHNDPGAAFCPTSDEDAKDFIVMSEIQTDYPVALGSASYHCTDRDFIYESAQRGNLIT